MHKIEHIENLLQQEGFELVDKGEVEGKGWEEFQKGKSGVSIHWW